ncbi:MAG: DUF2254 family protein [Acidimicrobiales bacterium]
MADRRPGLRSRHPLDGLVELARGADCVLVMVPAIGEFVPAGAPLFLVRGDGVDPDHEHVAAAVVLSLERTLDQDVAYGFRLLVDIAERSLAVSPFLDPTTAVQAIDRLHDCLRQLVVRPFPTGDHHHDDGELRLVVPTMDWDAYVHLAFDEIRMAGAGSPQVSRRLRDALDDLVSIAPPERTPVLRDQLERLGTLIDLTVTDVRDAAEAAQADRLGLGVSASAELA